MTLDVRIVKQGDIFVEKIDSFRVEGRIWMRVKTVQKSPEASIGDDEAWLWPRYPHGSFENTVISLPETDLSWHWFIERHSMGCILCAIQIGPLSNVPVRGPK